MQSEMIIALLSLAGTLAGAFSGIMVSNRMVNYRIEQLEKKVDRHNSLIARTAVLERDMKSAFRTIDELKREGRECI